MPAFHDPIDTVITCATIMILLNAIIHAYSLKFLAVSSLEITDLLFQSPSTACSFPFRTSRLSGLLSCITVFSPYWTLSYACMKLAPFNLTCLHIVNVFDAELDAISILDVATIHPLSLENNTSCIVQTEAVLPNSQLLIIVVDEIVGVTNFLVKFLPKLTLLPAHAIAEVYDQTCVNCLSHLDHSDHLDHFYLMLSLYHKIIRFSRQF